MELVTVTAFNNLIEQKGRVSESSKKGNASANSKPNGGGKNGKKINTKREQTWKQKELAAREKLKGATTKKEKKAINKEIKDAANGQKKSENHARSGTIR